MADDDFTTHRDLAAFHCFEMARDYNPHLPEWDSDDAAQRRTEYRYLITAAHRRSRSSCVLVAIERIAGVLAVADGEAWPACNRAIKPELPELQRLAIAASRRQRYRHLARLVHADLMNYYELGTDGEDYRMDVIAVATLQMDEDKRIVGQQRKLSMPSTVTQIHKDADQ